MLLLFLFLFANWAENSFAQVFIFMFFNVSYWFALSSETYWSSPTSALWFGSIIEGDMQDVGSSGMEWGHVCSWAMAHQPLLPNWICIWILKVRTPISYNPLACTMFYHVNVNIRPHHHQFGTHRLMGLMHFDLMNGKLTQFSISTMIRMNENSEEIMCPHCHLFKTSVTWWPYPHVPSNL